MIRFQGWRFAALLAVPMLLVVAGVYLLVFDLIERVSTGANDADHQRVKQVVQAAFDASERQLATLAVDNSLWEDAVRNVYEEKDEQWFFDTWGVMSENSKVYDAVMLFEEGEPAALQGFKGGKPFMPVIADYFDACFTDLLKQLPQDFSRHDGRAALMHTQDGIAVVAAAPVMSPDLHTPGNATQPKYLIFMRYLTTGFVSALGRDYLINDLKLAQAGGSATHTVHDREGHAIVALNWSDNRPGDAALDAVKPKVGFALSSLTIFMITVGALCWYLVKSIASREAAARRDALTDSLTGLPNRVALADELKHRNTEACGNIALVYADLDGFKEVNDRYDHHVGDELIRMVAARMTGILGPHEFLARVGGDEFVAMFEGLTAQAEASLFAERLIAHLKPPFDLDGRNAIIGASIGIACVPGGGIPGAELLRRADVAMYEAKAQGRNRLCIYSESIDEGRMADLRIAAELRSVIKDRAIDVVFQPVVRASDFAIVAVEALARWPKHSHSRWTPDKFIAIAEENGLIDDLGALVLEKACAAMAKFETLRLAVNISPVQMRSPQFVKRSLDVIRASGIDFARVEFEVTEGVLLDSLERARVQFAELRKAGITIALDDFGSGYSSVGYLKSIEFDRIKIDRSIVSNMLLDTRQQSIIQGTVIMAHGMAAEVIAEGVESLEEAKLLRLAGCQELQGYYFHKPMPAEELGPLFAPGPHSAASFGKLASAALNAASS